MKRVFVTGLGAITPLGVGAEYSWQKLLQGTSTARTITRFDHSRFPCQIACQLPETGEAAFNFDDWIEKRERRRLDLFTIYGLAAAKLAFDDAGWRPTTDEERARTGTAISSGIGGLSTIEEGAADLVAKGKVSPFFVPKLLINMVAGQVSIREGLRGPNTSPVTACASGAHSIGDAARLIALGAADAMVAGGAEAAITPLGVAGFCACRAMSTNFNDRPEQASRPYDKDRDGFVMGEGAGAVILESEDHAKARGAKIYAELIGYGLSGDAYHMTSPAIDGSGATRAMQAAIKDANLSPSEIGYINAHGTSTPAGDAIEIAAIERVFANQIGNLSVSSTKSSIGHLLGAAGAVEAIFSILAMRDSKIPPTINLDACSVETAIDLVPHQFREKNLTHVMSNSFGFGGTNASLIFTAV